MTYILKSLLFVFFLFIGFTSSVMGQMQVELAQQYFRQGEFEKSAEVYKSLYEKNVRNEYYLMQYVESLVKAELYEDADQAISKALKDNPSNLGLLVKRGAILESQGEDEKANKIYQKAINKLPAERFGVLKISNAFSKNHKYDLAIKSLIKGSELLKDDKIFAYNLGALYQNVDDQENMIRNYLLAVEDKPQRLANIKAILSRYLKKEDFKMVQAEILKQLQGSPENDPLTEMLVWTYVQQKNYRSALRQVRAVDMRKKENGRRIFDLAVTAMKEQQFSAAMQGFKYIIDQRDERNPYFTPSNRRYLQAKNRQLERLDTFNREGYLELEQDYLAFLSSGINTENVEISHDLAMIQAYKLGKRKDAIQRLNALLELKLRKNFEAEVKLDLADFYLMESERWESTLLYSQVDKAFPETKIGHEARFRNAKLSYYSGDFEWAQQQFDILKSATTRLIANDAIDMSVFIMDNLNLDTTNVPLSMYARAELLSFQSKFDESFATMDSLEQRFPEHDLIDDTDYLKANIFKKLGKYTKAEFYYKKVVESDAEGIRADNALFELAELLDRVLEREEEAMLIYERIYLEYENSLLAVDARKRYRALKAKFVG